MFKKVLRLKSHRTVALWIVVLLALPFLLFFHWGAGQSGSGPGGTAGVIFGRPVPWERYDQAYRAIRRTLESQFAGNPVPDAFEPILRQQTWDRLILQEEARRRVAVTDEELARDIQSQPTFQQAGRFDSALYFRFVRAMGFSPQLFEEHLRDDLRVQKLLEQAKAEARLTDEETRSAYANEHDRLRASLAVFPVDEFASEAARSLTEADLRAYYEAHPDAVRIPLQRTIEYVGLPAASILEDIPPVTEEAVQAFYEERRELFTKEDHAVTPLEEARDVIRQQLHEEAVRRRMQTAALDLQEDVEQGLRLEEISAKRALAIQTAGPIKAEAAAIPNGPTTPMLRAAFGVPLGQLTQVFETPMGVFLLRPQQEIPTAVPPFQEARGAIEPLAAEARAREKANARAEEIRTALLAARNRGLSVEEAFREAGVTPLRPLPFVRRGDIESLGEAPDVAAALFALKPGECSTVLAAPKAFVVGIVDERLPFDPDQFAKDRDAFRQTLLSTKQTEYLAQWVDALRQRARLTSFLETPH